MTAPYRNRIVASIDVDPADIDPHPLNWRRHPAYQMTSLDAVLRQVGFTTRVRLIPHLDPAERARGRYTLVDGEARLKLLRGTGQPVPADVLDLTEAEAELALLTHDKLAGLAESDPGAVSALADAVALGFPELFLDQVGWRTEEVAAALSAAAAPAPDAPPADDPREVYRGLPPFEQEDQTPDSSILVHFASPADRAEFFRLIGQPEALRSIWHPRRFYQKPKEYVAEDAPR